MSSSSSPTDAVLTSTSTVLSRSSMMSGCSSKETRFRDLRLSNALSSFKIEAGLELEAEGELVGGTRLDFCSPGLADADADAGAGADAGSLKSEEELDGERRQVSGLFIRAGEMAPPLSSLFFRRAFFSSFLFRFSSFSSFVFFVFSFFVSFSSFALIAFRRCSRLSWSALEISDLVIFLF